MKSDVKVGDNRVTVTRTFDAPRPLVFGWWTKAEKLQQWSGCRDAIKCEITMDFRVGGSFTQRMQIAGAGEFSLTGTYDEIVPPERIVYRAKIGQAVTRVAVEFFEQGKGTKVVPTHAGFPDEVSCKAVSQGTAESFDKLDSLIASRTLVTPL